MKHTVVEGFRKYHALPRDIQENAGLAAASLPFDLSGNGFRFVQFAIADAIVAERTRCHRQIGNMMEDFFLIEERIHAGQIDRARGTAYEGAKTACRELGISPMPKPITLRDKP